MSDAALLLVAAYVGAAIGFCGCLVWQRGRGRQVAAAEDGPEIKAECGLCGGVLVLRGPPEIAAAWLRGHGCDTDQDFF